MCRVIVRFLSFVLLIVDEEGLIAQALLLGNINAAVELSLKAKRFADAIIIAMTGEFI